MSIVRYKRDQTLLITAALNMIKSELDRINYNHHQKEMPSPFDNTGVSYKNDTFSVSAYNWVGNIKPNFEYEDLRVWWYKHNNRGVYAECGHELTFDDLNQMIKKCCDSIERDWRGKK